MQRPEGWQWRTESGEQLTAAAGDWEVSSPGRPSWSVTTADLRATYEHVDGDRWRRTGQMLVRPAVAGETVETQEGADVAEAGSWVVRDDAAHEWVVPADVFAASYAT